MGSGLRTNSSPKLTLVQRRQFPQLNGPPHHEHLINQDMLKNYRIRRLLDDMLLPKSDVPSRWVKQIPIKVNVLAWKISMVRLPTRVNLHRRGVQVSPISCPICCEALENLDHLLFCCDLAKDIARFNQVQNKCWKECFTLPGGVSGHIETISSSLIRIFEKMTSSFDQPTQTSIDQSPLQEISIQDMEDLKQHYLDEILSLSNDLQIKDYRNEKIDIHFRRECESMIDELKASYFYDDDDDDEESSIPLRDIISELPLLVAITPDLPITDSLIMGDEHLNTIPEKESDEFINLVLRTLFQSSEDTSGSDSDCDLPLCNDFSPINIPEEKSVTFSNPLFDLNDDFTSSDDESLSDEDVSEDNVKIYSNPLFEFDDEYISSDVNPLFDEVLENIESKDSYVATLMRLLLLHRDPSTPKISVAPILEGFTDESPLEKNDDLFDLESKENKWKKILYDAPIDDLMTEDKVFDPKILEKIFSPTYVSLPFEDRHYLFLTYVIRIFLPYLTYSKDSSLLLSSGSEDTIFDPDISVFSCYSLKQVVSHRSGTFMCFNVYLNILNESPMEIFSSTSVFNDEYDTPSHTKKVFANMRRKGKDFSRTVTPLFPSMLASQAVEGEGSGQPTEPQHTPTTALPSHSSGPTTLVADETVHEERGDSVERAATTAASLDAEQDSGNINRTQSTAIPNVPFPQGIGSGGSPRCQEAIGDTIAQTRSERVSTPSYDSPLLGVNTPGSDEERIELKELMDMCTKLSDRVLDLENVKDAQALEIKKLKKRVKKLERKNKSRTPQPKRRVYKPRVESSKESLGEKDASKQGRNSDKTEELNVAEDEHMFDLSDLANTEVIADQEETIELVEDKGSAEKGISAAEDTYSIVDPVTTAGEIVTTVSVNPKDSTAVDVSLADDVTLAKTLMAIRSSASRPQKLKGVLFKELSEPTTIKTSRPQPQIPTKDKVKGIMQEPEKPVKVKGKYQIEYDADVAQRLQVEIDADAQLAERLQAEEREHMSVKE
ncbi:gag-pol polyprotein [Tanacetum coccineum]|uniref:Gag-pol polyprotein n=1 Tax=Tanacetum coccineum TaxID=301880 RepID=A0ABQ5EMV3_9ASTR